MRELRMKFMFMMTTFLVTGTMLGANPFKTLINPSSEKQVVLLLEDRIKLLPDELQRKIYYMVIADVNKATIKKYIQESLKISQHKQRWYDVEHYFAFRKYGTECTHIVAFYAKKNMAYYNGLDNYDGLIRSSGSTANVYLHTLKHESIEVVDCIEEKVQRVAPARYNGINLYQRKSGSDQAFVFWLSKSDRRTSIIVTNDLERNMAWS
jgi:hypothetical protein